MPKNVMLTHANIGANATQNIHPGTSRNQIATGNFGKYKTSYVSLTCERKDALTRLN